MHYLKNFSKLFFTILIATTCFLSCNSDPEEKEAEKITLTYNYNIGENPKIEKATPEAGKSIKLPVITYDGYVFLGWAMSADASEPDYLPDTNASFLTDTTLYGVWADKDAVVQLTLNAGTFSKEFKEIITNVAAGQAFKLPEMPFKKTGYHFIGWAESSTTKIKKYSDGATISLTKDTTLYAIFISDSDSNLGKIIYHSNDGTDRSFTQYCDLTGMTYSSLWYKLEKNEYKREGYIFAGWAKIADATDTVYDDEVEINRLAFVDLDTNKIVDVHLYAVWYDASKLYVIYKRNYSSSDTEEFVQVYDVVDNKASFKLIECPFEPEDSYYFGCWKNDLYPGETVNFESETTRKVTYKALWNKTSNSFEKLLTYYSDKNRTEKYEYHYNWSSQDEIAIKEYMFDYNAEGEEFVGWAFSSSNVKPEYLPWQRVGTFNAPGSLYPLFSKDIVLTFNANDGTGRTITKTVKSYKPVMLTGDDFTNGEKKLMCWSKRSSTAYDSTTTSSDVHFLEKENYFSQDTTLYAVWSAPVTYTFDANDGSGRTAAVNTYQNVYETCPEEFTRTGYDFAGWAETSKSAPKWTEKNISDNKVKYTTNKTLYAVWSRPITIKMYSNLNETDSDYSEVQVDCNLEYYMPNTSYVSAFGRDIYKSWTPGNKSFKRWLVNYSDETSEYISSNKMTVYENTVSLVAEWWEPITIVFHSNFGDDETKIQYVKGSDTNTYLQANEFVRDGYTFKGWAKSPTATNIVYTNRNSFNYSLALEGQTLDLYAIWQ